MSSKKLSSVKRSISLRSDVYDTATEMVDLYFGGNFSAYVTYLICADKHGVSRITEMDISDDEKVSREKVLNNINEFEKNEDAEDYIDSVLNSFE